MVTLSLFYSCNRDEEFDLEIPVTAQEIEEEEIHEHFFDWSYVSQNNPYVKQKENLIKSRSGGFLEEVYDDLAHRFEDDPHTLKKIVEPYGYPIWDLAKTIGVNDELIALIPLTRIDDHLISSVVLGMKINKKLKYIIIAKDRLSKLEKKYGKTNFWIHALSYLVYMDNVVFEDIDCTVSDALEDALNESNGNGANPGGEVSSRGCSRIYISYYNCAEFYYYYDGTYQTDFYCRFYSESVYVCSSPGPSTCFGCSDGAITGSGGSDGTSEAEQETAEAKANIKLCTESSLSSSQVNEIYDIIRNTCNDSPNYCDCMVNELNEDWFVPICKTTFNFEMPLNEADIRVAQLHGPTLFIGFSFCQSASTIEVPTSTSPYYGDEVFITKAQAQRATTTGYNNASSIMKDKYLWSVSSPPCHELRAEMRDLWTRELRKALYFETSTPTSQTSKFNGANVIVKTKGDFAYSDVSTSYPIMDRGTNCN